MEQQYKGLGINQFSGGYNATWRKQLITLTPSLNTIDFTDTNPNLFALVNSNDVNIYGGFSILPNVSKYEFKAAQKATSKFGQPIPVNQLYLYNPSAENISIILFSMQGVFDFTVIEGMSVNLSTDNVNVGSAVNVSGFNAGVSLPSGSNLMGKVNVPELDGTKTIGKVIVPELDGNHTLGNVKVTSVPSNLKTVVGNDTLIALLQQFVSNGESTAGVEEILSKLSAIKTGIDNLVDSGGGGSSGGGSTTVNKKCLAIVSDKQTTAKTYTLDSSNVYKINHLSNDGSNDLTVNVGSVAMTVKAGEVLADIDIPSGTTSVQVSGTNISYRILYSQYNI